MLQRFIPNFEISLLHCFSTLIFGLFSFVTLKTCFETNKYKHIPGPPVKGIFGFYFGHLLEIKAAADNSKCVIELFEEWSAKYGKVFKVQLLFGKTLVITTDQKGIKEILIDENFPKFKQLFEEFGFPLNERFIGRGLGTIIDNQKWKHNRAVLNQAFNKQVLIESLDEFNSKADILLERIRLLADGKSEITLFDELNRATLEVIASVAYGMNIDAINNKNNKLHKYISEGLEGFQKAKEDPFIWLKPTQWKYIRDFKNSVRNLRAMGKIQIESRLKLIQEGLHTPNDFLNRLIESNLHKDEEMDMEYLIDEFITFFVGGQETTANALAFCILELARNPDVTAELKDELDKVFGSRSEVKLADLYKLNYTSCVIKETLRLWPPASAIPRENTKEFEIDGFKIPEKTFLLISPYLNARKEDYFQDPLIFKPERFLGTNQDLIKNYTYFPFSLGPRNCIGQNLAQIEMKIILSKLVKNFEFKLVPGQNLGINLKATLRPRDGTKCYITPRMS